MLKSGAGRGRPRTFDEDAAVDAALQQFWRQGYRATTTRGLETALDMSQPSIYNAFGSKRDLLLRTMDLYEARIAIELLSALSESSNGYEAVEHFMARLTRWMDDNQAHGCLMVNMMVGDIDDDVIAERVERYRRKVGDAFAAAIARTEPDPSVVAARADILLAAVLGLHIAARSAGGDETVATMATHIKRQVSEWRSDSLSGRE
ncbi:MAG: TetR/AcrR family transcriptional regulator [Acidimicrobiia bacterium]|nr:TetR/AcrR family transcriptional regulator [Acidimicrobiia bacterium]